MKKQDYYYLLIGAIGFGAVLYFSNKGGSIAQKRQQIINYIDSGGDSPESKQNFRQIIAQMSEPEVNAVYTFLFTYIKKGKRPQPGSALYNEIDIISKKYSIFT